MKCACLSMSLCDPCFFFTHVLMPPWDKESTVYKPPVRTHRLSYTFTFSFVQGKKTALLVIAYIVKVFPLRFITC